MNLNLIEQASGVTIRGLQIAITELKEVKMRKTRLLLILLASLVSVNVNAQQLTAEDHLKQAVAHFKAGELDLALTNANTAIELNPRLAEAYRVRHLIRATKDPETEHYADCDMVVRLAPDAKTTEPFYVCRANARARQLDWSGATADMTRAIEMAPNNGEWYSVRSFTYLCGNDLVKARADYEKALQIKPTAPSPFVRRGYFRYWKKDFAGAVDDFTKAIEWKPDYAVAYAERAFAHGLLGNIDAALADVQQAVALNPQSITLHTPASPFSVPFGSVNVFIKSHPTNARAYEVRGVFNLLQDKRDDAMSDFNQTVALQPSLKSEVDRIIARLRN